MDRQTLGSLADLVHARAVVDGLIHRERGGAGEGCGAATWHVRRFRPNLVLDADGSDWLEDSWAGRSVRIRDVVIGICRPCERCTMVTRPQPGLDRDLDVYRALARHHHGTFGMWSDVRSPGTIAVTDQVELVA